MPPIHLTLVDPVYSDPYLPLTPHEERAKFYGMVANIDENVGGLRRRLAELGLAENTIFIFMTDNGSAGGVSVDGRTVCQPAGTTRACVDRRVRSTTVDTGYHFFSTGRPAGISVGRDVDEVTANVDVLPTLIEMCGLGDSES